MASSSGGLAGKTVWVVGASSGIGAAVAQEALRRGAKVAISARRRDRLDEVAGGEMTVVPLDVTSADEVSEGSAKVERELGSLDIAVLCAGYWKQMDAANWDTDEFDRHVQVNLIGMSNSIAAVLPEMLRRRSGHIVGISSVAGFRGLAGSEAYGATKAGQINLLEALRVHVARTGVKVTTVCPGFVRTELTDGNAFPMPFMIEPEEAGVAICDAMERPRPEVVFPKRMGVLMKTSRLVPTRLWPLVWRRSSLP